MNLKSNWYDGYMEQYDKSKSIVPEFREIAISSMAIEPSWNLILTPLSLEREKLMHLEKDLVDLLELWLDLGNRFFEDFNKFIRYLGYDDNTIKCLSKHCTEKMPSDVYCRWDIIFTKDGPKILELNIGSNTGGGNIDAVGMFYDEVSKNKLFSFSDRCKKEKTMQITRSWAECIVKKLNHLPENLALAIVEEDEAFDGYKNTLSKLGEAFSKVSSRPVIISKTSDFKFENDNTVLIGEQQIGAIYSFFTLEDVMERHNKYKPLMDAILNGYVEHIMGFGYIPYGNKVLMGLLSENQDSKYFKKEESMLIRKYIPESKVLAMDSREYAILNREKLLCKPADSYGGIGILCGWEFTQMEWEEHINSILTKNEKYILQEKVTGINQNLICVSPNNDLKSVESSPVIGIYMVANKIIGGIVRAKEGNDGVVNVTNGASIGILLVEEDMIDK